MPTIASIIVIIAAIVSTPHVRLTWEAQPGAAGCIALDMRPGKGQTQHGRYTEHLENFIGADALAGVNTLDFTGEPGPGAPYQPVALEDVAAITVNTAVDGAWMDEEGRSSLTLSYHGETTLHFILPITLRWNHVPGAVRYAIEPSPRDGASGAPLLNAGGRYSWVYGAAPGECPPGSVKAFRVHAISSDGVVLDSAETVNDGGKSMLFLDFPSSPVTGLRSRRIVRGLADPKVFLDGGRVILMGTDDTDTSAMPIYQADAKNTMESASFTLLSHYEPNRPGAPAYDPAHAYYHLWGPEVAKVDGGFTLYFTAIRLERAKDGTMPPVPPVDDNVAMFQARAGADMVFGTPAPFDMGLPGVPGGTVDLRPPATSGSPLEAKLDVVPFMGVEPWRYFYTWFERGNHIASFVPVANAPEIIRHVDPTLASDEEIVEAPDIQYKGGFYYLFFSTGFFSKHYKIECVRATEMGALTRMSGAVDHVTEPIERFIAGEPGAIPRLWANAGHSSALEIGGEWWLFYHIGRFRDGRYEGPRSTYAAPLRFKPDGGVWPVTY